MRKTLFILLSFVVLLSTFLIACNGEPSTTTSAPATTKAPTTTSKPVTTTAAPKTTTAAPTGDKYGGILQRALTVGPARPIGYLPEAANDSYTASAPALERLAATNLDGSISGVLATSWEVGDDLKSVTIHLRKGVKFHDGSDFNADVCKWNLDNILEAKTSITRVWESIDKIDDYTIRINVTIFQNKLLNDLASGQMQQISKATFDKEGIEYCRWHPVGTGPFIFESYERDAKITYKRNPDYWQAGKPYLDGVEMTVIADSTVRTLAFKKGDIDVHGASGNDAVELKEAGYTVSIAPGGTFALVPDSKNSDSPWADINVRFAASYALDRDALAQALGFGFASPAYQLGPGYIDSRIPDLIPTKYDPDKAKKLLKDAGYPNGFKTRMHGWVYMVPADYSNAVAAQLREVGIEVETDSPTAGAYTDYRRKGWSDGVLSHGFMISENKNYSPLNLYFSGTDMISLQFPAGFKEGLATSLNSKEYDPKLVQAVLQLLYDDMTIIPYMEIQNTTFYRDGVHNPGGEIHAAMYWDYEDVWKEKSAR